MHRQSISRTEWSLTACSRYWRQGKEFLRRLPVPQHNPGESVLHSTKLFMVELPDWAQDITCPGGLLVPLVCLPPDRPPNWMEVDWWGAISWFLSGAAEMEHERRFGPVHSYAYRLKGFDTRLWERAWVNRMALFLRRWAARLQDRGERQLFGPLPDGNIVLTHDVDAVSKTFPLRLKHAAWLAIAGGGSQKEALVARMRQAVLHAFSTGKSYWNFEQIQQSERDCGVRSIFNVYGGTGGYARSPLKILLDPSYDTRQPRLGSTLRALVSQGWEVGLHPSFTSWDRPAIIRQEKKRLESALGSPVHSCRQHWLRFSWQETWAAQEAAGLAEDHTLGFNDRPGFRVGAALRFSPWPVGRGRPLALQAVPLVAMDSHFFHDQVLGDDDWRFAGLCRWVDEVLAVRGVAGVVWHQRVWSPDYRWQGPYERLLARLASQSG